MTSSKQGGEDRTYYAVPSHYGIGSEYDDLANAVAAAKAAVQRFFYRTTETGEFRPGSHRWEAGGLAFYSRAFIDRRVKGATGDKPVERIEVFLTDAEKDAMS